MHERLTLADELHDAMLDAPDLCAQCGAILSDTEPYLCDGCTETAYCADSDICEPWDVRMNPYYAPADRYGISVLGVLLLACLVAAIVGTAGLERVKAQSPSDVIRAPHAINGRIYEGRISERLRTAPRARLWTSGKTDQPARTARRMARSWFMTPMETSPQGSSPVGTLSRPHARRRTWTHYKTPATEK